jgi:hypothetical protein
MTPTLRLILLVLALICFFVAALGVPSRVNLTAAGLFLATLAFVIG